MEVHNKCIGEIQTTPEHGDGEASFQSVLKRALFIEA